ncbi:hypothetical protein OOT46_07675 [Aquabacterium sp. A7-Y]|uniref:hypothetical protein n=1 Tax=Aquabacterium sp. A7-Y TaxID=1349605 RepID=UPI00223D3FE9|nr:hypothetical protein [Aquabacterium sp. A7-Y]MCW7537728.1 hypothetical protein [Aquabacterium sp. A7-Y]
MNPIAFCVAAAALLCAAETAAQTAPHAHAAASTPRIERLRQSPPPPGAPAETLRDPARERSRGPAAVPSVDVNQLQDRRMAPGGASPAHPDDTLAEENRRLRQLNELLERKVVLLEAELKLRHRGAGSGP